jgi:hypothetical protein
VTLTRDFAITWRRRHLAKRAAMTTEEVLAEGAALGLGFCASIHRHVYGEHAVADHPEFRTWREPWDEDVAIDVLGPKRCNRDLPPEKLVLERDR